MMTYKIRNTAHEIRKFQGLPIAAKREFLRDHLGLPRRDPGIERAIDCGIEWLCLAQDKSASAYGGVADQFSLLTGWGPSYPETTGYIIPTMLAYSEQKLVPAVRDRAKRMLDWLVSIQFPDGSFQAGNVWSQPRVPTIFNTGQILIGLASGVQEFGGEYREPMHRAADWLVSVQDADGCWRRYESPLVVPGEKTYYLHVVWGLLEAARLAPTRGYADAALANVHWALVQQAPNGWFRQCCLNDPERPLTHTLGYALRGLLEAYRFTGDAKLLNASQKTADHMLRVMRKDGFIAGRLLSNWQGAVKWACLTGTVQIAHCWLLLYRFTGESKYRDAAQIANRYVRRLVCVSGPPEQKGGVKGAFPTDGAYGSYSYLNWASKFFVDSNILEKEIMKEEQNA
jgi:hypothetical protein